jgi:hypothetical protein
MTTPRQAFGRSVFGANDDGVEFAWRTDGQVQVKTRPRVGTGTIITVCDPTELLAFLRSVVADLEATFKVGE